MAEEDAVAEAEAMIKEGKRSEPEKTLRQFVAGMPPAWTPVRETADAVSIAYWDMNEFIRHAPRREGDGPEKRIDWVTPSYSKAFYLLAFLAVERQNWPEALNHVERGLALEPDHPLLLCEKALILSRNGLHELACTMYFKASRIRPWAPERQVARALRGAAVALIDLERLDDAEKLLLQCQELEPDSVLTRHELGYIQRLRSGAKPSKTYDLY